MKRRRNLPGLQKFTEAMQREGQGVWQFDLIWPEDRLPLIAAGLAGDPWARSVVEHLAQMVTAQKRVLCLLCPAEIGLQNMPGVVVMFGPKAPDASRFLMSGICAACCVKQGPALPAAVLEYYRENLLPDAREISIHPSAGSA